ncbi:hypothetical protein CNECB9_4250006 [Cupriavidus necator]|uniref:Uncharacterized protein n=1 Tax=Cupriavidus necator TaxID=106590 RepID=A0A1K0JSN9_CUPNE|nr:hypothetical protein CNECB9_4250006 [Cupriavidus necator]
MQCEGARDDHPSVRTDRPVRMALRAWSAGLPACEAVARYLGEQGQWPVHARYPRSHPATAGRVRASPAAAGLATH